MPTSADNVFFDAGSDAGADFTVTLTGNGSCNDLTISGLDYQLTMAGSAGAYLISGNVSFPATNLVWSSARTFSLRNSSGTKTLQTNGVTITGIVDRNTAGGTTQLLGALTSSSYVQVTNGTFDANGYNVTAPRILIQSGGTLNMGSSTFTVTGGGGDDWSNAGTISAGTSRILFTGSAAKTFVGGGATYYILDQGGSGALTVSGSNAFNDIQNSYKTTGATTIRLTAGTTQTVSNFTASGESGRVLTLDSTSAGSAATLSKASGTVTVDYLSIKDSTATGGATWNATNSTNVSGNTGWNFVASGAEVIVPLSSLTLAGYAPVILTGANVDVPLSSITFSGQTPTIATGANVEVGVSTITLTAYAPSLAQGVEVIVPLSTLVLTANAPTISTPSLSALARITLTGRFSL